MDLAGLTRHWARWRPGETAVSCQGRDVSWQEFDGRTQAIATRLRRYGLRPGDRLAIMGHNSLEWCVWAMASFKEGVAVVPVNPRFTPSEVADVVTDAGCRLLAVDEEFRGRAGDAVDSGIGLEVVGLDSAARNERRGQGPAPSDVGFPVDPARPAVIAYTSGTTGAAKGVVLTHRNLSAHVLQLVLANGWTPALRTLLCASLAFTSGIATNLLATLAVGGTLVLERSFEADRALDLLASRRIGAMMGVPVVWQSLAEVPGFGAADLSSLATAIVGGAPVPMSLLRIYQSKGVTLRQGYGLTEASGTVSLMPASFALQRPDSAGLPVLATDVRIANEDGGGCLVGDVGEIQVRGPQVMSAYWNNPEATAAALTDGWLRTGDLGRLDGDGFLEIVDRKKDMLISGGLNVYPAEIERVLAGFPGMAEVAVISVPDRRWGESPAAIIRGPSPDDIPSVLAYCRERLADYKVPRHVVVLDTPLPRSMSGKLLRNDLKKRFRSLGAC